VIDDSHPDDRPEVKAICEKFGAEYMELAFTNYAPQWCRKFNRAYEHVTGDIIQLLCSNWLLGPDYLEKMVAWLQELGPGTIVAADNARKVMKDQYGVQFDWYAGRPDKFCESDFHLFDLGFLYTMYKADWEPWDEDLDPPEGDMSQNKGSWHGVTAWGYLQMNVRGRKFWIRRDMDARHDFDKSPTPRVDESVFLRQTYGSEALVRSKRIPI
jgi:hypothetical protein